MNKWLITVFAVAGLAFAANAQPPKRAAGTFPMERADSNGDGEVSWAEVHAVAPKLSKERFNAMDRNGDGLLSKADVASRAKGAKTALPQGEQLRAILRRADADGDQKVTKEELEASAPQLAKRGFARLDLNKDGVISAADRKNTAKPGTPSQKAIEQADANGDGLWSYEELKTVAKQLQPRAFRSVDGNGDGLLNANELQALRRTAERQPKRSAANTNPSQTKLDAVNKILQADADGDGGVTFEELVAAKPGYPRSAFDRNDGNKDGVISTADAR